MNRRAFTLIELLTVVAIIGVLASLVLMTSGFIQKKAAASRSENEIQALSTGAERYKTDNAIYPRDKAVPGQTGTSTDTLDARKIGNPASYKAQSLILYKALSGDTNADGVVSVSDAPGSTVPPTQYYEFPPQVLYRTNNKQRISASNAVQFIQDPFGYSYGYSTIQAAKLEANDPAAQTFGYNPTFDLWSTNANTINPAPGTATDATVRWIKNW